MPTGSLLYLTLSRFFSVAGDSFQVTVHTKSGVGHLASGLGQAQRAVRLDGQRAAVRRPDLAHERVDGHVHRHAEPLQRGRAAQYKISAQLTDGAMTGYTDNVVQVVPGVEGRFQRWGKFAEYDQWVTQTAPQALRLGRSPAVDPIGTGETISVPGGRAQLVQRHPVRRRQPLAARPASPPTPPPSPYSGLAPGADTTVTFQVTNTDTTLASSTQLPGAHHHLVRHARPAPRARRCRSTWCRPRSSRRHRRRPRSTARRARASTRGPRST